MHILKIAILLLTVSLPGYLTGQSQFKITHSVFGAGGSVVADSVHEIKGTLGQPIVGETSSQSNTIQAGFWNLPLMVTSVEETEEETLPEEYQLQQNYPNPFNPTTTLQFAVPKQTYVTLKIYDLLGRLITTLVEEDFEPGVYDVNFPAEGLPSGVYFYRIAAGEFVQTKKMLLIR